jgi:lysophospholipase L1-like esterase
MPSTYAYAPIVDPPLDRFDARRPFAAVAQPTPGIVLLPAAGAKAVFLGDSYTTGWNRGGVGARGWPQIVGGTRGWQTVNLAVAGTGFVNRGSTNQPVRSMVAEAIRQRPDIVFVAAGHNDTHWTGAVTGEAADDVVERLHRALPEAVLVIVAPIWHTGHPPARSVGLRDHLRREAAAIGAVFIDPLGEGWFAGSAHRFIGRDGVHPTDAGHRHIAELVLADLAGPG